MHYALYFNKLKQGNYALCIILEYVKTGLYFRVITIDLQHMDIIVIVIQFQNRILS